MECSFGSPLSLMEETTKLAFQRKFEISQLQKKWVPFEPSGAQAQTYWAASKKWSEDHDKLLPLLSYQTRKLDHLAVVQHIFRYSNVNISGSFHTVSY